MVASGLPTRIGRDHVVEMANMALEMLSISAKFHLPGQRGTALPLRIGVNCGS